MSIADCNRLPVYIFLGRRRRRRRFGDATVNPLPTPVHRYSMALC